MKVAELRAAWEQSPRPAVIINASVSAELCAQLRDSFEAAGPTRSWLAHRHRVTRATLEVSAVEAQVRSQVCAVIGSATLTLTSIQAMRFDTGDYLLLEDDVLLEEDSPTQPHSVEAVLDFSLHGSEQGQVAYCQNRQPYFAAPQEPGALAMVARLPNVARFVPYLTRTNALHHPVYRLVVCYSPP